MTEGHAADFCWARKGWAKEGGEGAYRVRGLSPKSAARRLPSGGHDASPCVTSTAFLRSCHGCGGKRGSQQACKQLKPKTHVQAPRVQTKKSKFWQFWHKTHTTSEPSQHMTNPRARSSKIIYGHGHIVTSGQNISRRRAAPEQG